MLSKIIAFTIIAVLVIVGWIAYWLYRFAQIRYEPIVESDAQAHYIEEIRTNITKQVSSAFCAIHHVGLEDEDAVQIRYQVIGYTSNLMIVLIGAHWLKAYFDWYTHKITLEYYLGGNEPRIYKFRFNRTGVIPMSKLLGVWYKDMVRIAREERESYSLQELLQMAQSSNNALWEKMTYDQLLKFLLEEYAKEVSSIEDVGMFCALVNLLAKGKKAREIIKTMLPQEDSSEEEAKQASFLLDKM